LFISKIITRWIVTFGTVTAVGSVATHIAVQIGPCTSHYTGSQKVD